MPVLLKTEEDFCNKQKTQKNQDSSRESEEREEINKINNKPEHPNKQTLDARPERLTEMPGRAHIASPCLFVCIPNLESKPTEVRTRRSLEQTDYTE